MEHPAVQSIADLEALAEDATKRFEGMEAWFRGQASAQWRLWPKAIRDMDHGTEASTTYSFVMGAPSRHAKCPPKSDQASWLSLMQHYGAPTRLLDWTESVLVAAFFAVAWKPTEDAAAIWALSPAALNDMHGLRHLVVSLDNVRVRPIMKASSDRRAAEPDDIIAARSGEIDPRMMVQQSRFTVHGSRKALEDVPEEKGYSKPVVLKYVIPPEAKGRLCSALDRIGITEASMFPDLEHLASYLTRRGALHMAQTRAKPAAGKGDAEQAQGRPREK